MKAFRIAAAAALLMASGAATAQSATDAKCIILSNLFAQQAKDANQQKAAEAAFYFYLGRIGSQASATSLKALMDQQAKTLTDATAGPAMNNCVKDLQSRVQLIQSIAPQKPAETQQQKPQPQGR